MFSKPRVVRSFSVLLASSSDCALRASLIAAELGGRIDSLLASVLDEIKVSMWSNVRPRASDVIVHYRVFIECIRGIQINESISAFLQQKNKQQTNLDCSATLQLSATAAVTRCTRFTRIGTKEAMAIARPIAPQLFPRFEHFDSHSVE